MLLLLTLLCCEFAPAPVTGTGTASSPEAGELPHDHGAGAPAGQSLDSFGSAYRAALVEAGGQPCTWQHDSGALRCPDGGQHDVRGLYAWVAEAEDRNARADALIAMISAPPPLTWERVEPQVRLRLVSSSTVSSSTASSSTASSSTVSSATALSHPLHPDQPDGPQLAVELALPGGTRPMTAEDQAQLGVGFDQLLRAAVANTDRIDPEPFWPLAPGAARSRVGDGHDGDRLLSAHIADLDFQPTTALVVPGQLTALADASGQEALRTLAQTWTTEDADATLWWLQLDAGGWRLLAHPPVRPPN